MSEVGSHNFDTVKAIDSDSFFEYLNKVCSLPNVDYVFVDGFLLFYFDIKFDRRYFFTLTKEECREKRSKRKYKTVDNPGYFDKIVWPSYLEYLTYCKAKYSDIIYLNGALPFDHNYEIVKNDLLNII